MKNSYIIVALFLFLSLNFQLKVYGDEFNFEVSEIEITENGNMYKGSHGGAVTTNDGLEFISDNFYYDKINNKFEGVGNVKIIDKKNNITLLSNKVIYLKNREEIFSEGVTTVNINNQYNINGTDLFYYRNKMVLHSENKTSIRDVLINNFYSLADFEYFIIDETLKGKNVQIVTNNNSDKTDTIFLDVGFFDLKNKNFLAKDLKIYFDKKTYDNKKNDPRLKGVYAFGDEYSTTIKKGSFTTCKQDDECPPWMIKASDIKHDKVKKRINYKNAWLKVYDVPVVYFPRFFHPDPTVERQSGFLKPSLGSSQSLGDSIYTPYFQVFSDNTDLTFKPRIFGYNKFVLQNEFRHEGKDSSSILDFSVAKGHNSSVNDKKDTRSHFFGETIVDLNLKQFLYSGINVKYQKTSNDTYLKSFNLFEPTSRLNPSSTSELESYIKLDLEAEKYNFSTYFKQYEVLDGLNSDRYQYILPGYDYSQSFDPKKLNGYFNFSSSGTNDLKNTNVLITTFSNDVNYSHNEFYFDNGIRNSFGINLKNLNSSAKNSGAYKSSLQSEVMTSYIYNMSLPLIKYDTLESFTPKLSLRISPHEMKNFRDTSHKINAETIFNTNRLGLGNSYEAGESLTIGFEYKKEKTSQIKNIKEIEDFIEMKLATSFRLAEENKIPKDSTLDAKQSNIFGEINYNATKNLALNFDFSLTNDLDALEYTSLDVELNYDSFFTTIKFNEEKGVLGNLSVIENNTRYNFDENNSLKFNTRRNRKLNLTEYYDLIYEYKNDCLVAGVKYKKSYYNDVGIKPTEELFFTITIIPLTTFSPDKILLK